MPRPDVMTAVPEGSESRTPALSITVDELNASNDE
jgi:hypothetical protein